jgi:hypothetical protein
VIPLQSHANAPYRSHAHRNRTRLGGAVVVVYPFKQAAHCPAHIRHIGTKMRKGRRRVMASIRHAMLAIPSGAGQEFNQGSSS